MITKTSALDSVRKFISHSSQTAPGNASIKIAVITSNLVSVYLGCNLVQKKATSSKNSALDSARTFISLGSQTAYCNASINIALIISAVKLKDYNLYSSKKTLLSICHQNMFTMLTCRDIEQQNYMYKSTTKFSNRNKCTCRIQCTIFRASGFLLY